MWHVNYMELEWCVKYMVRKYIQTCFYISQEKSNRQRKTTLEVQKNLEARCLSVCACFIIAATLWPNVSRRGHTKWKGSHAMEQKKGIFGIEDPISSSDKWTDMQQAIFNGL